MSCRIVNISSIQHASNSVTVTHNEGMCRLNPPKWLLCQRPTIIHSPTTLYFTANSRRLDDFYLNAFMWPSNVDLWPSWGMCVHTHTCISGMSWPLWLGRWVNTISQLDIQILYTVVYKHLNSRTFVFKCRVYVDACRWTFSWRTVQQLAKRLSTAHGCWMCYRYTVQQVAPVSLQPATEIRLSKLAFSLVRL